MPVFPDWLKTMHHRPATDADCLLLGELNHQLIQDENHRNPMTPSELAERMRDWLRGEYSVQIFEQAGEVLGYALYRQQPAEIYLRQLFVVRDRRRQGLGRQMMQTLREEIWPQKIRLTVDVLTGNSASVSFWRSLGYRDYCLTLEILPPV